MHLTSHAAFPAARYYSLGEPGPTIRHSWFCLPGHDQQVKRKCETLALWGAPGARGENLRQLPCLASVRPSSFTSQR